MTKGKSVIKNQEGFTLIEVVLSIAILAIISTSFLKMFTSSIVGISNSGKKSDSHFTAQNQIETNINDSTILTGSVVNTATVIKLTFSGDPTNEILIPGRQIDVPYNYGSTSKELTTFTTH
ncbi:type II secretion system protein [Clostridium sp.]|uniref:type IV pilus modification PilV family protein n=1 Tax=Clostridium sp. TaxID=1506 RepID=UPI001A56BA34|nr:type II secretion system protein [Clostridium sp.]MBK5240152.1 type II secretion system protein [Clostridium sp.]